MKINLPVTEQQMDVPEGEVLISTTDTKGAILYVNDAFCQISGFSQEELIGYNHNVVRHPDMPPQAFEDLWQSLKENKPWLGLVKNRCKNGGYYWVEAYVSPQYEGGQLSGYQSVRVGAHPKDIKRANTLYQQINRQKALRLSFIDKLGIYPKLMIALLLTLLPVSISAFLSLHEASSLWVPGIGLLISSVVGGTIVQRMARPLSNMAGSAKSIVDNPILQRVILGKNDELAVVASALAMQAARLRTIEGRADDAGQDLDIVANNMSTSAKIASLGMEQARQEISQVASAITQMSDSIAIVADNIKNAAASANHTKEETDKINLSIASTVGVITLLESEIKKTSETLNTLAQESNQIGAVVDVIREIADKTNMLALNAAIEAARAGESGRGFAVVADEVRNLANLTMESTEKIQKMTDGLQNLSKQAVATMEISLKSVETSVNNVTDTAESISRVSQATRKISELNSDIAASAEQQNAVAHDINDSVQNIHSSVTQVAHSAQTVRSSAERVTQMANRLNSAIGKKNPQKQEKNDDTQLDDSTELF